MIKCPNCGAKYDGNRCPDCGRITDPRDRARQNKSKIIRVVSALIGCVGLVIVGYNIAVFNNINEQIEEARNYQASVTDVADSPAIEAKQDSEEKPEIVSGVENYLSEHWDGEYSVRVQDQKIEAVLCASGEIPEFLDAAQEVATEISIRMEDDPDLSRSTVMVKAGLDSSAEIYLTFFDGKLSFRADEAEEYKEPNDEFITMDEFNQIQAGMSYQDVVNIVGSLGELVSSVDIGDPQYKSEMYSWEGKGSIGANANVMFQGGTVSSKAQFGLE